MSFPLVKILSFSWGLFSPITALSGSFPRLPSSWSLLDFLSSIFKALFDTFPVILITLKYAFHTPDSPLLLNWKFLEPESCHSSLHWPENSAHTWYPASDKRKNEYIFPRERAPREKCKGSRVYALIGGAEKRSQRKRQKRSACGKSRYRRKQGQGREERQQISRVATTVNLCKDGVTGYQLKDVGW